MYSEMAFTPHASVAAKESLKSLTGVTLCLAAGCKVKHASDFVEGSKTFLRHERPCPAINFPTFSLRLLQHLPTAHAKLPTCCAPNTKPLRVGMPAAQQHEWMLAGSLPVLLE